jgi:alkanesulfonate monooxygenase SsuD/methylene tetrahydromethanopterin reductase-like flavin-dependent oxidoreductase (luciferase family)
MRVSVGFDGSVALREAVALARAAEECGLDGVWNAEHVGLHDAIVASTAMVMATDVIGVGVVGPSAAGRHPGLLAMELSSIAELAGGRFRAQVGLGDLGLMAAIGGVTSQGRSPLRTIEQFVTTLRALAAGETVTGEVLGFELRDFSLRAPTVFPLDVMAIRPQMLALACRLGDGVALSVGASRKYLLDTVATIRATESVPGSRRITAFVYAGVTDSIELSAARVARQLAFFDPPTLRALAPDVGLPAAAEMSEIIATTGRRAMADRLSPEVVRKCGLVATPDTLATELLDLQQTGLDEVVIMPAIRPADWRALFESLGRAAGLLAGRPSVRPRPDGASPPGLAAEKGR